MDAGAIQTTLGFTCGAIVGCGGMWMAMRLKLDAVRSTALMISDWWIAAEDKLEEAHQKHVRAGRTAYDRHRERVKDVAAQIAISPPVPLKSKEEIKREANYLVAMRRVRLARERA